MKKPLILINCVGALLGIAYGVMDPIFPIFAKNVIGATYVEVGVLGIVDTIPYAFIPVFVGFLLYRYNNGKILTVGIILNVVVIYMYSVSHTLEQLMFFTFIGGIGFAFFWPPCMNIITNMSTRKNRLKNRIIFHGFFTVGTLIGPLLDALLFSYAEATYTMLFQVGALILAFAIIVSIPLHHSQVCIRQARLGLSSLKWVTKFPMIITMVLFCSSCFGVIFSTHAAFLGDKLVAGVDIAVLFFILGIVRIITLFNAPRFSKRTGYTMIAATGAIALGMVISFLSDSVWEFAVSIALLGFGISLFYPMALEIILSRTAKSSSSVVVGTYEALFGLGGIVGAVTGGVLSQFVGVETPYLMFFIIGVVVVALSWSRRHNLDVKKTSPVKKDKKS